MTNSRLNAVIKNHRTTSAKLTQLACENKLTAEQATLMIWHKNADASIMNLIFSRYSKFPEVSLSIAKRFDIIDECTIERLADVLTTNMFFWNRGEWTAVMNVFKEKIQNHHFAQHSDILYLCYDDCANKYTDEDEASIYDSEDSAHLSSFKTPFGEYDHLSCSSNISDWE